jgi:hypothetical protein
VVISYTTRLDVAASPGAGQGRCSAIRRRLWGAKWGAIVRRHQTTLSPYKRSIYLFSLTLSDCEPHRTTAISSFASRGSGSGQAE